jgi:hypothetical protein
MGVPTSEVGYTSAKTGRGDHEDHKRHVVGGNREKKIFTLNFCHFPIGKFYRKDWDYFMARNVVFRRGTVSFFFCESSGIAVGGI